MNPLMRKEGYGRELGASVNISSAVTGLLIPPSNVMIVYSLASGGVSIAALFLAGYLPGILLGLGLMVVAAIMALRRGIAPVQSDEGMAGQSAWRVVLDSLPSLFLIFIVMGGIVLGWFTPTEASAIAVVYTFVLSVLIYREVNWKQLPGLFTDAACTTAVVLLLVGTSMGMSWVMAAADIPQTISESLLAISDRPAVILFLIIVLLLVVGTFMDMTPAILIFTPILLPVVTEFGMSPIHFGIVLIFTLCVGLVTPPVGGVLFVGCGVAGTTIAKVWRHLLPFFFAMLAVLLLVAYVPGISLWLPNLLGF